MNHPLAQPIKAGPRAGGNKAGGTNLSVAYLSVAASLLWPQRRKFRRGASSA